MTQSVEDVIGTAPGDRRRVPAEPEFWIFILGDLAIFTAFFFVWAAGERADPVAFAEGRASLSRGIGIANTLVLLASSGAVALAVRAVRDSRWLAARTAYGLAIAGGVTFLALKAVEYSRHLGEGIGALAGPFFVDYFVFTGVHAVHVVLGLVVLAVARARVGSGGSRPMVLHEAAATWWHVIDIVWIVLFTLIYLG